MGFPNVKSNSGSLCIVYSTEGGGEYPIHGAYSVTPEEWIPLCWDKDGYRISSKCPTDLDITKELFKIKHGSQENQSAFQETDEV